MRDRSQSRRGGTKKEEHVIQRREPRRESKDGEREGKSEEVGGFVGGCR